MLFLRVNYKSVVLIFSIALNLHTSAFLLPSCRVHNGIYPQAAAPVEAPSQVGYYHPTTALQVVADPPMKEDEKKKGGGDNGDDWIPSKDGGFIPNIKARLRPKPRAPTVLQITDIQQYKDEVADVRDRMVCVRFYAPWCRACKAVESSFRRLPKEFPDVKFVEVPVTRDNTYLHKGLGIPSLPFAHIYDPSVGLVEEQKINKDVFGAFKETLKTYVDGECPASYDEE
jgi:thiol-disulfide isomerase/thioredoxin